MVNMLRRDFSLGLAATSLATGVATPVAHAQAARGFQEGADYIALEKRVVTDPVPGKVEVVEFFWYSCGHCNAFEPALEAWIKKTPKDVVVRRVPVAFQPNFEAQQRLFYSLEAMGKLESLHAKVFYAIHVEKQQLNTFEAITAWVDKQGVKKDQFVAMFNSFSIATKARKATQLQNDYKVDGVPSLGIAGRFITSASLTQTMARALEVTDYLIAEVRKNK
jgi:protein dithiol oxidoreductase (disulfide-forming)